MLKELPVQNIIYVQWTNNYGGLEKISQDYEHIFKEYEVRVLPLRYNKEGLKYDHIQVLKYTNHKILLYLEYFYYVLTHSDYIYHLQYPGSRILLLTYLGHARKIIFHFHGTKFRTNFFDKLVWKVLGNRITVIANSNHTKFTVNSRLSLTNEPIVISNMINHDNFPLTKRKISGKFLISYAGRFTKGKNLHLIIETAKFLRDGHYEFHLYGDGPEKKKLMDMVLKASLEEVVYFHPFADDINQVFQKSNLFLFLSAYESFGNVVAESIMSGLPVLCNKIPALQEFISEECFFIDRLDPEAIAGKINYFSDNYKMINDQVQILSEKVRCYLQPEKISNTLRKIYQKLELEK